MSDALTQKRALIGTCHSGYAIGDQPYVTDLLIKEIGEPGPFIMIGTMDDAPTNIYRYAINNPHDVVALIVISYSGVGTEWKAYQAVNSKILSHFVPIHHRCLCCWLIDWDRSTTIDYAVTQTSLRISLSEIIQSVVVTWGLMEFMIPPSKYYEPAARIQEQHFLNLVNEKRKSLRTTSSFSIIAC
jgi:hypothetical protein